MNAMGIKRFFLTGVVLCALAVVVWAATRPDAPSRKLSDEMAKSSAQAGVSMEKMEYVEMREGKKEWKLLAKSAHFLNDKNVADLEQVELTFYTKDNKEILLTADNGKFNSQTQDIQVWGNVNASTQEGYRFTAPAVHYDAKARRIASDHVVTLTGPSFEVTGKGMTADVDSGTLSLKASVTATVKPEILEKGRAS